MSLLFIFIGMISLKTPGRTNRPFFVMLLLAGLVPAAHGQSGYPFTIRGHFTAPPPADTVYLYIGDQEYKAPVKDRSSFQFNGSVPRTLAGHLSLQKGLKDQVFFVDTGTMVASFTASTYTIESNKQTIPVLQVAKYEQGASQAFIDQVKAQTAEWSYPYQQYAFNEKVYRTLDSLVRKYRDNDAMVFLLSGYTGFLSSMQIKKLRGLLTKEAQKCSYNNFIEEGFVQSLELETFAPIHSDQMQLRDMVRMVNARVNSRQPGYILIDFWATWCKPCLEEMEVIKPAVGGNTSVNMISISFDGDSTTWRSTVNTRQLPGYHFLESKGFKSGLADDLNIKSLPYNVLIDPFGNVIARGLRGQLLSNILKSIREQRTTSM